MSELKELLNRAIFVAYWRDRDIDTENGTFASTDTDEMIRLESAIQEFFGGMESNDLIGTGRVDHYIDIAIKNHESTELEQLRKERDEAKLLVKSAFYEGYSLGYGDGNSDGQSYVGKPCRDDKGQWKSSDSIEALAKLTQQGN